MESGGGGAGVIHEDRNTGVITHNRLGNGVRKIGRICMTGGKWGTETMVLRIVGWGTQHDGCQEGGLMGRVIEAGRWGGRGLLKMGGKGERRHDVEECRGSEAGKTPVHQRESLMKRRNWRLKGFACTG
eukprot:759848-Hanusia_phi.AAC.1